ncbi:MAG TPA: hypothetical protein DEB09_03565 [Candidatus Magasanikbacteria bacterium]|nr:hypothetical protein [Candidatus Magasanikbacteria bacterium]
MRLSLLQKHILLMCLDKGPARNASASVAGGGKIDRKIFRSFYGKTIEPAKEKYQESIITRSLEHLIDREFMTGFGRRTPHKWFITHVSLTKKGVKISQDLLNERQEKLPLK